MNVPLTTEALEIFARRLAQEQPFFQYVMGRYGPPPLWGRPPGFATLVWIILEQQVSLASARAAFMRLQNQLGEVTPGAFLTLDDTELKTIGFSRQKTAYARGLAQALLTGELDLEALAQQDDEDVRKALIGLKGIGPWTADIYLLMALGRPDVWPAQDLGLVVAVRRGLGLAAAPSRQEMETIGAEFRPYRSVATRFFWHYYLSELRPPKS